MHVRILGSAAGGGVPQWNCRCANCNAARQGGSDVRPRTQSSVAVSADGRFWFLLNVSPDVRQQILAFAPLGPPEGETRGTSVVGCVLTDAELDHVTGLLLLREGSPFALYSTVTVRRWLNEYLPIEKTLFYFSRPIWRNLYLDKSTPLPLPDGTSSNLFVRAFEVDRHAPRFVPNEEGSVAGSVIGLVIEDALTGGRLVYAPCVATIGTSLGEAGRQVNAILLDGTFWDDDEPLRAGIGTRTARQMKHIPVTGPEGSLTWLANQPSHHRIYTHINNTNPMLNESGPEYRQVRERGVRVAADGDTIEL